MLLGVKPAVFLGRLLLFFFLTYVVWKPLAPAYTSVLATLTSGFLHLTEVSSDPNFNQVTEMRVRETAEGRPAIFYQHRRFPALQSGIPAEWVQANLVLLIPLMLATPARTYAQRFVRLGLALAIAVALQVLDITVTVKTLYASQLPGYGSLARRLYQFADAFAQSMDAQLFPFAIWAGIHFNQLLGRGVWAPPGPPARKPGPESTVRGNARPQAAVDLRR
jgi:hypothetical protein